MENEMVLFSFGLTVGFLLAIFVTAYATNKIDQKRVEERILTHKGKVFRLVGVVSHEDK